jgi:hypothetical protein
VVGRGRGMCRSISNSSVRAVRGAVHFDGAGAIVMVVDFPKKGGKAVLRLRIMVEGVLRIMVKAVLRTTV